MGLFKNQVAVITGAGSGIGKVMAEKFAREGAAVALVDSDKEKNLKASDAINRSGGRSVALNGDVSCISDVERVFDESSSQLGPVKILVNNAGITHPTESIIDLDLAYVEKVFAIDYKGVYLCSRRAGKEMIAEKCGCIINISSIAGLTPLPLVMYGPMKSAVNMLTRILAMEWAGHGIRVNAIAPGYVLTPLIQEMIDKGLRNPESIIDRTPMKQMLQPEEIADAAIFLASSGAKHITGAVLPVDGGWIADGGWSAYKK